MKKQLIFMPPDDTETEEISFWMKLNMQNSAAGYPLVVPPGWNYTIEKISDPVAILQTDWNKEI